MSEQAAYSVVGGNGVSVDWSKVVASFQRMTNADARKAAKQIMRKAGNKIKKPVQEVIKQRYPGGKKYPRNKGRKSGMLKGVQYGSLYKDVKMSVYKNAKGVNVSLFSPKQKQNRWCVLMWLNDGTNERGAQRSIYTKTSKSRRKQFASSSGMNRGKLSPAKFFEDVAQGNTNSAAEFAAVEFERKLVQQFNK